MPPPPPPHRSLRRSGSFAILAVAVALIVAARAADAPAPPPCAAGCSVEPALPSADIVPDVPPARQGPSNDPAVQASMPGCLAWTDRCVTCERDAGKTVCSNIGIACQPQVVECLRAEPPDEKKTGN